MAIVPPNIPMPTLSVIAVIIAEIINYTTADIKQPPLPELLIVLRFNMS